MWNSPHNRNFKLTPRQLQGIIVQLNLDWADLTAEPNGKPYFLKPPYDQVPNDIAFVTAIKVIETLVTDKPVPPSGHNALEEATLYGLCTSFFSCAAQVEADAHERKDTELFYLFEHLYMGQINEFRKLAGQKKVRSTSGVAKDQWEDTIDIFFHDRDWEMMTPGLIDGILSGNLGKQLGIDESYINFQLQKPSAKVLRQAEANLDKLITWVQKSDQSLPKSYKPLDEYRLTRSVAQRNPQASDVG